MVKRVQGIVCGNVYEEEDVTEVVNDFRKWCRNAISLDVCGFAAQLVSKFGSNIDNPRCYAPLRELAICSYSEGDRDIWPKLGTLESLSLSVDRMDGKEFDAIQENCPNLRHIHIHGPHKMSAFQQSISRLYASYGHQLESALVDNMSAPELNFITNASKKARFDTCVYYDSNILPALTALGSQNEKIRFLYSGADLGDLSNA